MREYECLYILSSRLGEEEIETASARFHQLITDQGGEVLSVNPWGKRRLAYEIANQREGYFIQLRFNAETALPAELDRSLRYAETVLRHLIVRADELDPAASNTIPDQLPEHGSDDYDGGRRGRGEGRWSHAPAAAAEHPVSPDAAVEPVPADEAAEPEAISASEEAAPVEAEPAASPEAAAPETAEAPGAQHVEAAEVAEPAESSDEEPPSA